METATGSGINFRKSAVVVPAEVAKSGGYAIADNKRAATNLFM
jgi:hypothetical protein